MRQGYLVLLQTGSLVLLHGWIGVILGRQDWPVNTPAMDADDEEHAKDPHPMDNYVTTVTIR